MNSVASSWTKWIADPGHLRVVAIEATELVRELCQQQGLKGIAERGLADAIVGSLLIASSHKSNESINMNAKGSGPYRQAIIDASPDGRVRGFLIEESDSSLHQIDGNGYWGRGLLSILYTKNFEGKMPYTGMVPIESGFLDEAINDYYRDSEQQAAKLGFSIEQDANGIARARGVLIQALGGAQPEEVTQVQNLEVETLRQFAAEELDLAKVIPDIKFKILETKGLSSFCTCSQERIERALVLTGEEDIVDALGSDPALEITCDFCRTTYHVSAARIKDLFSPEKPQP